MITIEDDSQTKKYNILILDQQRFENWFLSDFECEAVLRLKSLLEKLFLLWNHRLNNSFNISTASRISAILALHGVPYRIRTVDAKSVKCRFHFYLKFLPRTNLMELFNEISMFEGGFREILWMHKHLTIGMSYIAPEALTIIPCCFRLERYILWKMAAVKNYRGVALYLSNMPSMRSLRTEFFQTTRISVVNFFDIPIYAMMSLHIIISNRRNLISFQNVGDRIFQLAYFLTISHVSRITENCVLAFLTECLTTSIIHDVTNIERIISLERNVFRLNMAAKYKNIWRGYHSIAKFWKWKNGVSHESASAIVRSLLEMLEGDKLPETSLLWIEAILYVCNTTNSCEDELSDVVEKCCNSPFLVTHLAKNLRRLDRKDELRLVVEQSCSSDYYKLHPSHHIWLDFVDVRITAPHRYGTKVVNQCVERLFSFLDYGSNRCNERAWSLLWSGVQLVSPDFLNFLWEERKSWWLRFHSTPLSGEAQLSRSEVLNALLNELR